MSLPSEAAYKRADEIGLADLGGWKDTLARYIQQVSDAAKRALERTNPCHRISAEHELAPFILPEPVDPLLAVLRAFVADDEVPQSDADSFRAALAKRGGRIVFGDES